MENDTNDTNDAHIKSIINMFRKISNTISSDKDIFLAEIMYAAFCEKMVDGFETFETIKYSELPEKESEAWIYASQILEAMCFVKYGSTDG